MHACCEMKYLTRSRAVGGVIASIVVLAASFLFCRNATETEAIANGKALLKLMSLGIRLRPDEASALPHGSPSDLIGRASREYPDLGQVTLAGPNPLPDFLHDGIYRVPTQCADADETPTDAIIVFVPRRFWTHGNTQFVLQRDGKVVKRQEQQAQ